MSALKAWEYRYLSFEQRVATQITHDLKTGCANFTGRMNGGGYGQIKDKGRCVLVHRWVWQRNHGPVPPGLCVLHHCDNPSCVNVQHLYVGDHTQNMRDKVERGRSRNMWKRKREAAYATQ